MKHIRWNYLALAFALPLVGMLLYLLILQFVGLFGPYRIPFGKTTMLYSDMYHQYYPFFTAFRRALLSGDSLLYSWDVGMGMDYLGLFSYYLASPLNLLCILLPESWTLGFFSLLVPVKLGFAGLFFAVFLKKLFGKNDLSITLFGSFYAMCGWALAYQWNVMWLDSFALLPLVALGTISLLRDKKFILYTVTLFLSIYANYYIGLFVCIFVLLLFVCYEICRFRGFLPLLKDLCRIALFSALAIGMTAFLELPAFQALQVTQSGDTGGASGLQGLLTSLKKIGTKMNIAKERSWKGLFDAMRQVAGNMGGGLSPSFKEGLPNLYSGVGTIVLAFLFLSAWEIKLRDKICSVLLLVFFILSTILRQLDYIWHGFHFTNMIPYRFTFLYSFVLLYMAYRAYLLRSRFSKTRIIIAGVLALGVLACSDKRFDFVFLCYNLLFLGLYLFVFLYGTVKRKPPEDASEYTQARYAAANSRRRHRTAMLLACVLVLELVLNMVNFAANFTFTSAADYPKGTDHLQSMVRYMKERETRTPFYRAEVTHAQTLNDGALIGYRGISAFTSSANVKVTRFMDALGYGAKNTYNRYCFEESSPVANLFLGLKYMLERGTYKENAYFDKIHTYGSIVLLENNAYLPLGFLANTQLANVDFSASGDHLKFQNTLLKAASGVTEDVWYRLPAYTLSISGINASVSNESSGGYCSYTADESGSSKVIYTYTPDVSGLLCVDLDLPKRNSFRIYVDDKELYYETYSLPQMLSICDVTPESKVEIHIYCASKENSSLNVKAAVLQEPLFRQAYEVLAASQLELTTFQNTLVEGTVQCDRDGLLYTSVPQDGNWVVWVDGTEVEPVLVGGAMIGIPLLEGGHTVVLRYQNQAFSLGWKISLACLLVFLVLVILYHRPRIKRGRYERR